MPSFGAKFVSIVQTVCLAALVFAHIRRSGYRSRYKASSRDNTKM
jgi:hypothetical protein